MVSFSGDWKVSLAPLNLINQGKARLSQGRLWNALLIAHLCSHLFCITCDGLSSLTEAFASVVEQLQRYSSMLLTCCRRRGMAVPVYAVPCCCWVIRAEWRPLAADTTQEFSAYRACSLLLNVNLQRGKLEWFCVCLYSSECSTGTPLASRVSEQLSGSSDSFPNYQWPNYFLLLSSMEFRPWVRGFGRSSGGIQWQS